MYAKLQIYRLLHLHNLITSLKLTFIMIITSTII